MRSIISIFVILIGCIGLIALDSSGSSTSPADEGEMLTVFAAASLTGVITEIAKLYEAETGTTVRLNFAGSSTLARQIAEGAKADIYLSANREWTDYLVRERYVSGNNTGAFLGNRLVVIAHNESILKWDWDESKADIYPVEGRVSVGDPDHVPAGIYTRQALESRGRWEQWKERLAPASNVQAALRSVERGETELGIVYATDAAASKRVRTVSLIPETDHGKICYYFAALNSESDKVCYFLEYINRDSVKEIFLSAGFTIPD